MNKMQKYLKTAADKLNLRIIIEPIVKLKTGKKIRFEACFPDLSNEKGIYVIQWDDGSKITKTEREELRGMGIGVSTFDAPRDNEIFNINDYKEMFTEWGWSGNMSDQPSWMKK